MKLIRTATIILSIALLLAPVSGAAAKPEKPVGPVKGHFSLGGMVLTITSQSEFEELWGLQVDYCDGSREEIGRYQHKIIFRAKLGSGGYKFYAEKPMQRARIKTLLVAGDAADDFRYTDVRRECGKPEKPPKLYCHDVEVAPVIQRSWEGEPISFKSARSVVSAGLMFPGVDGLAPARVPDFHPNRYFPSIAYNPSEHTWTGTFISMRIPAGTYQKVMLVVKDDFEQQAKCLVGRVRVEP
ncbi:MAG TPA: hypothetical protein VI776_17060 [Anaerolineales bacterium]|nr:hypothetical protein [Anaerolineales bacterium]